LLNNGSEILLVGDIRAVALDANIVEKLPCRFCADIDQAVGLAAESRFAVICLVMSSLPAKVTANLEALRRSGDKVKIYLLAQMYEEPIALELLGCGVNGNKLVDDYFICPVKLRELLELIGPTGNPQAGNGLQLINDSGKDEIIAELSRLATVDDLTGARNRRYVREFLQQIIDRAKEWSLDVTLLLFDIDNFKHYNDAYGHSIGDMILKQVVVLMRSCCRAHDVVARVGGDEFAVVFWDRPKEHLRGQKKKDSMVTGLERERRLAQGGHPREAIFMAERFRSELGSAKLPLLGPEGKGVLTISGGLASFPHDGVNIEELFNQADSALLEAKRSGKNRIYLVGRPNNQIK